MAATRLELNLMRLLSRCEALAAERRDPEEWRLEKVSPGPAQPSGEGRRRRGEAGRGERAAPAAVSRRARPAPPLSCAERLFPAVRGCSRRHAPGAEEALGVSRALASRGGRLRGLPELGAR